MKYVDRKQIFPAYKTYPQKYSQELYSIKEQE